MVDAPLSRKSTMGAKTPEDDTPIATELLPGSTIEARGTMYVLGRLLKDSGSRAVYLVKDLRDLNRKFAMKVERRLNNPEESKLKREVAVLKFLFQVNKDQLHFPELIDKGKTPKFNFIVVQLSGPTFADLRVSRPDNVFSMGTGLEVCRQVLEGIAEMHRNGFVHRDIRPSNFAVGRGSRNVLLIDCGIARRFLNSKGLIMAPRPQVGFKGVLKFAPISGHKRAELSPKDDVESWLYLLVDFTVPGGLPWETCTTKEEVLLAKQEARAERDNFFRGLLCKKELGKILDYIDKQGYSSRLDYAFLTKCIRHAATASGVSLSDRYDWEGETHRSSSYNRSSATQLTNSTTSANQKD